MALVVWAMGDLNSVDLAQCTHTSILHHFGCMSPKHALIYGTPFPTGPTAEGVYIDDHLVTQILPHSEIQNTEAGSDKAILEASEKAYDAANLPL